MCSCPLLMNKASTAAAIDTAVRGMDPAYRALLFRHFDLLGQDAV
jgi:hypothetical protein